jgi:hypothetical protein
MLSVAANSMANHAGVFLQHFRFHLEPKAPLRMLAYNKGNVIRGGFEQKQARGVRHEARGSGQKGIVQSGTPSSEWEQ